MLGGNFQWNQSIWTSLIRWITNRWWELDKNPAFFLLFDSRREREQLLESNIQMWSEPKMYSTTISSNKVVKHFDSLCCVWGKNWSSYTLHGEHDFKLFIALCWVDLLQNLKQMHRNKYTLYRWPRQCHLNWANLHMALSCSLWIIVRMQIKLSTT